MSDEEMRSSPRDTSEATPPHAEDDSPEMVNQPSPPEEQRVSSSTDQQQTEKPDSPVEPSISSTSDQELNVPGPSNHPAEVARFLLGPSEARVAGESPSDQRSSGSALENGAEDASSRIQGVTRSAYGGRLDTSNIPITAVFISESMLREALSRVQYFRGTGSNLLNQANQQELFIGFEDLLRRYSLRESNEQHVKDSTSVSNLSSKKAYFGCDLLRAGSERGSSRAIEDVRSTSESSSKTDVVEEESGSSSVGAVASVGLNELTPPKVAPVSGGDSKSHLSSETDTSGLKASIADKGRDMFASPKRKSPTKLDHLSPKRSAPLHSPDKLKRQSASHMSALLEELDIKETKNQPGCSEHISGHQDSEAVEPEKEVGMEVQETDDSEEAEKSSENDESE